MSLRIIQKLHEEALAPGAHEAKTTKYWLYLLSKKIFSADKYVVAAEQPITGMPGDRSRVDLLVQDYSTQSVYPVLLFQEMKSPSSEPGVVQQVENQAFQACNIYVGAYDEHLVWAVTTLGTRYRTWQYRLGDLYLRPYEPKSLLPSLADEYIDSFSQGRLHLKPFERIRDNPSSIGVLKVSPRPDDKSVSGFLSFNYGSFGEQSQPANNPSTMGLRLQNIDYGYVSQVPRMPLYTYNQSAIPESTARIINAAGYSDQSSSLPTANVTDLGAETETKLSLRSHKGKEREVQMTHDPPASAAYDMDVEEPIHDYYPSTDHPSASAAYDIDVEEPIHDYHPSDDHPPGPSGGHPPEDYPLKVKTETEAYDAPEDHDATEYFENSGSKESPIEVTVYKEEHFGIGKDLYVFRDYKGREVKSKATGWIDTRNDRKKRVSRIQFHDRYYRSQKRIPW